MEQKMLADSAAEFLAKECPYDYVKELEESDQGYSPKLWEKISELGWLGIVFPEEYGGFVRAHAPSAKSIKRCAKAGLRIIDHADKIDEDGIEAVLKADAFITPSLLWSVRFLQFAESWDHTAAPFPIGDEIQRRFSANDFAVASMLDSVASAAADKLAELVERHFRETLDKRGRLASEGAVLRYSPGYCGWHISGQGRLFDVLEPEQIGVSLSETFLMLPLKSVSGVLIAGPATIHDFPNTYPFCSYCETQGCRSRIRSLLLQ